MSMIDDTINSLRRKGAEFTDAYNVLMNDYSAAVNSGREAEWQQLKDYADTVKNTISYINNAIDSVGGVVANAIGLSGLGNMGFLPLIPIAYVTAAIAALTYIIGEIYKFHSLMNATPQQVQQVTQGQSSGGSISQAITGISASAATIAQWVVIGGLAYYLVPKVLEKLKGARA